MSKKLVTYFSATGVTAGVAKELAAALNADLYEIRPEVPYEKKDLNWINPLSRSSKEMRDKSSRPAIADKDANVENYDVIFVGFPVWWYIAPTVINTFLESYDFSNKQIILFATSGGSGFGKTAQYLKDSVSPTATITEGRVLNGKLSHEQFFGWARELDV